MDLDKIDRDEVKYVAGRRGFFKKAGDFSIKSALASLPICFGDDSKNCASSNKLRHGCFELRAYAGIPGGRILYDGVKRFRAYSFCR